MGWFETSAKENLNINLATETLVNKIIENGQGQLAQEASPGTVNVKADSGCVFCQHQLRSTPNVFYSLFHSVDLYCASASSHANRYSALPSC